MKCRACQHRFAANVMVHTSPGGQSSPGVFFALGAGLAIVGVVLLVTLGFVWPWLSFGLALFVWLQCFVAWFDCRGLECPKCGAPAAVRPWSF